MTGAGGVRVRDNQGDGDVLTGHKPLTSDLHQLRCRLRLGVLAARLTRLGLCGSWRCGFADVDEVGEHGPVALADLDPHRDRAVLGDGVQQGAEGAPRPRLPLSRWREGGTIDGDIQGTGLGGGDDHVRQHHRRPIGRRVAAATARRKIGVGTHTGQVHQYARREDREPSAVRAQHTSPVLGLHRSVSICV